MISSLLSRIGLHSMEQVLEARVATLGPMETSVDGGAGWGGTSQSLAEATQKDGRVHAFEPFPGNHRFFSNADPRIQLHRVALSDNVGRMAFYVSGTVGEEDAWATRGFVGYSSLGHLVSPRVKWVRAIKRVIARLRGQRQREPVVLQVDTTRLDSVVGEAHLDFVKLDLQGGEPAAIRGMGALLQRTDMLWIEFTGQEGLIPMLLEHGFLLFDTNYMCPAGGRGQLEHFDLRPFKEIVLSTSRPALLATRARDTADFLAWFHDAKKAGAIMQTDLLAINPAFLPSFLLMLQEISVAPSALLD